MLDLDLRFMLDGVGIRGCFLSAVFEPFYFCLLENNSNFCIAEIIKWVDEKISFFSFK